LISDLRGFVFDTVDTSFCFCVLSYENSGKNNDIMISKLAEMYSASNKGKKIFFPNYDLRGFAG